jgi:hypothetical protein
MRRTPASAMATRSSRLNVASRSESPARTAVRVVEQETRQAPLGKQPVIGWRHWRDDACAAHPGTPLVSVDVTSPAGDEVMRARAGAARRDRQHLRSCGTQGLSPLLSAQPPAARRNDFEQPMNRAVSRFPRPAFVPA